ncbi:hypothetical protein Zm00014a_010580 [Zea mays]|uniref:Uncharacterized protein n=1 Tax=Zea mays TaxID=4577 RepID=A0A317Y064_MAIZE|nr:hypothetical protein Zm00014a_010580 [Zea mays]
MENVLVKLS